MHSVLLELGVRDQWCLWTGAWALELDSCCYLIPGISKAAVLFLFFIQQICSDIPRSRDQDQGEIRHARNQLEEAPVKQKREGSCRSCRESF